MAEYDEYENQDIEEDAEDLMENDEVSPEEEGFLKGYDEDETEDEKVTQADPEDDEY